MELYERLFPAAPAWVAQLCRTLFNLAEVARRNRDERNWLKLSEAGNKVFERLEIWQDGDEAALMRTLIEIFTGYSA